MLVQSPVAGDSRVLREAQALAAAGHAVHVVGRGVPDGFEGPDGVPVESVGRAGGLRPGRPRSGGTQSGGTQSGGTQSGGVGNGGASGSRSAARVIRPALDAARWLLLPEHRARVERAWRAGAGERVRAYIREHGAPDVVHAHDFNTLQLAAEVAMRTGAALVYDSHEFWRGRARHGRPEPLRRRRAAAREDALLIRTDLVLTVSDGIAERLRARGARRVVVVRNSFLARASAAPLPRRPTGLVYAGRIGPGRDLETLVDAAPALAAVGVRPVIVGPADADHLARLRARADGKPVDLRPEPLPLDDVDEVYRREGLAVVTLDDSCENHRLALPNKLFHAVRAGIPVVAADLPELSRAVRGRGIGATYRPGDAASLAAAVAEVAGRYQDALGAVAAVQELYRWERDAKVLVEAYDGLPLRQVPGVPAPAGSTAR
jgi:glycosyltransferase involved in cell wall biosynthesis